MVDIWAVIGDANVHKSSTVRALTGVRQKEPHWTVLFLPGPLAVPATFVHPSGIQEKHLTPQAFIGEVVNAGATHVIAALRYSGIGQSYPDALTYFAAFANVGWNVVGYAVLLGHRPWGLLPGYPNGTVIPNAGQTASNDIAARFGQAWGIV